MELLERAPILDELDGLLRRAAEGQGRFVLLGGEAGVGKTALVQHFCDGVRDTVRVLIGACDALSTPRPLGPLLDIAATVGGELARLLDDTARRDLVFGAVLAELGRGARPTLVVIEDVHWADEATLDLLRYLGRRLGPTRTLLIATYRDEEVGPRHPFRAVMGDLATAAGLRRLALTPLTAHAVRLLAAESDLDPDELHRRTGGNPFFVTEVLAAGDIPPTVQDAVLARVARLSPAGQAILDVAAVIGSRVEPWLVDEIGGADADAVDECLDVGMLRAEGNALAFRHELAREAVLATTAPRRRVALHGAVLRALRARPAATEDPARLAHHAEEAGDREAVLTFAPAAARRATALRAGREATAQYARALRFAGGLPDEERLSLLEAYAEASDLSTWGTAAIAPREEMIALARRLGNRLKEAEHLGWLAITHDGAGRDDDAERAARAALAALEGVPEGPAHAMAYAQLAEHRMMNRTIAEAVAWGERAIALAERFHDVETLIQALNTVGGVRLVGGDEARGRADLERCLRLAREAGHEEYVAGALADLGSGHGEAFSFDRAERYLTEAIAYATERDLSYWRLWSVAWLAVVRLYQGRWTEASDLAASVLRLPTAVTPDANGMFIVPNSFNPPVHVRVVPLLVLGRVRARRGDPEAAVLLAEALALWGPTRTLQRLGPIHAALAEAAWLAGDPGRAAAAARATLDLTAGHRNPWLVGELASWRWRAGDLDAPPPDAAEPFTLQIAGDWRAAAAAWDALGCPYETAMALADGDEPALRQALATFERLGARPAAAMAARRLRDLGARHIPRGPRAATRANPANLTPRQLDILALIAEGRTNAEVAERLYLSPKTVEHHVTAILTKLGVGSRAEAVEAAHRLGLLPQNGGAPPPI